MAKMKWYDWTAFVLLVVGALVHGIQAFSYYPVDYLLPKFLAKTIYGIVGIAGLYSIIVGIKLALKD